MSKAIIFDFDGTIVDSLPAAIKIFEEVSRRKIAFTEAEIAHFRSLSVLDIAKELKVPRWKFPMLAYKGRKLFKSEHPEIPLQLGLTDVLEVLHEQGYKLYIVSSNTKDNIASYLMDHNLLDCFDDIYGDASLLGKSRKIAKLVKEYKIEPSTTWYVGDETRDIAAARRVGLKPLSVSWGYNTRGALETADPDALVDTPDELQKTLLK